MMVVGPAAEQVYKQNINMLFGVVCGVCRWVRHPGLEVRV